MNKYSYKNVLAKTDVSWGANIIEIELGLEKKLYLFLFVDVSSNRILESSLSHSPIA